MNNTLPIKWARFDSQNLLSYIDKEGTLSKYDANTAKFFMVTHLKDKISNPTIGLMSEKRDIIDIQKKNPIQFEKNLKTLLKNPTVKILHDYFNQRFKVELYPKTWKKRLSIINNDKIVFYGVKPASGIKRFFKALLK